MKITLKLLEQLSNHDLVYPKGSKYYRNLVKEELDNNSIDYSKLEDGPDELGVVSDDLFFDLSNLVNKLASMLIEERAERKKLIKDLQTSIKSELYYTISQLSDKNFNR